MPAIFECYNPSGQLIFDLQSHTSRLLKIFGSDINETTHTFNDDEMGGGTLFWYTTDPINMNAGLTLINHNQPTFLAYSDLIVSITSNQIYFKKTKDITLYVGVRV